MRNGTNPTQILNKDVIWTDADKYKKFLENHLKRP